jgi:hypothetical protein
MYQLLAITKGNTFGKMRRMGNPRFLPKIMENKLHNKICNQSTKIRRKLKVLDLIPQNPLIPMNELTEEWKPI